MEEQNRITITLIDIMHAPTVDPRIPGGCRMIKRHAAVERPLCPDSVAKVPKIWTVIFSAETYTSESRY